MSEFKEEFEEVTKVCEHCGGEWLDSSPEFHMDGCHNIPKGETYRVKRPSVDDAIISALMEKRTGVIKEPEEPTPQKRPCAAYGLVHVIDTGGDVCVGRSDTKDYWVLTDEEYEDLEACVLDILDQRNPRIEFACVDMGRVGRDLLDSFKPGEVVHDE